ncbi:hypothetical protein ACFLTX_03715 [Chloroflexota bacterium]
MTRSRWIEIILTLLAGLILGLALAFLDGRGNWLQGWFVYGFLSSLACISLLVAWRWVGSPVWLAWLLAAAFILRLFLGVTYSHVLPRVGYDTEVQNAGFIAIDAYSRDLQSWELASSQRPILDAFDKDYAIDQYGGMEVLSAFVYRYISPDLHRSWLIILLGSWVSALGVAFLWKAARLAFNEQLAALAAWILAFYPENVWLGGSQMREPFLVAFVIFSFHGLTAWIKNPLHRGWLWLLVGLLGLLLFSPGVSIFLIVFLGGWAFLFEGRNRIPWKALGLGLGVSAIAVLLFWIAQSRGALQGIPLWETLSGWVKYSVNWDIYQLERDSGMIQYLFNFVLPQWLKVPFIFIYGLLQPVLPAAIFDAANGFWQIVGIIRSLGWYLLIPLILFSFQGIWRSSRQTKDFSWLWLFLASLAWIVISSIRAGGDQWDNPRYRTIFLAFQSLLAAKAWLDYRQTRDPWFIRIVLVELVFVVSFALWYASRYTALLEPLSFPMMVAVIIVFSFTIVVGGWFVDKRRKLKKG